MEITHMHLQLGSKECLEAAKQRVAKLRDSPRLEPEQLEELNRLQAYLAYQSGRDVIDATPMRGDVKADIKLAIHRAFGAWVNRERDRHEQDSMDRV